MKRKVLVIFTGGTISMKVDPKINAPIPSLSSDEVISMVTNIDNIAEIEVLNYSNLPSPHINPNMMMDLSILIRKELERDDIIGVVLTHGTDTLEETAYLLDLTINSEKPVVVIGAMRNSSELGYDGSSNLAAGICTAISKNSRNKGVLVVMNNEVNAAREVTKTNTLSLDTFKSPEFGPLGLVDNDQVIFQRNLVRNYHIDTYSLVNKVALIKAVPGMSPDIIDFYINKDYKGIVIEAFGRGNLPPSLVPYIEKAIKNHIPIVMVSRCPTGRVLDTYGYEGGGRHLRSLGIILGGNLPGQKARIKLMLALSVTSNMEEVKNIIEKDLFDI